MPTPRGRNGTRQADGKAPARGRAPGASPTKGVKAAPAPAEARAAPGQVSARARISMIEERAYFRAQARGFRSGCEVDDWLAAEREIDERLARDASRFETMIEKLGRERDELRVKMHLVKLDARQEWDALERKWESLKTRSGGALRQAQGAGRDMGEDVGAAVRTLAAEIRLGYRKLRRTL